MVSCTKGILNDTLETVNQVLERVLPEAFHSRLAFLSGPSFAAEVTPGPPVLSDSVASYVSSSGRQSPQHSSGHSAGRFAE